MDVILILVLIVGLIVALAWLLGVWEQKKKAKIEAEKKLEQENEQSRQAAKEKMQLAVVANHGEEPLEAEQTDISDSDLNKIKAAYAKFEKDVIAWETKLQSSPELSVEDQAAIRKEQLKYRMYFDEAFYEKHRDSVASAEWRAWTDSFSELLERHARLIEEEEPADEDDMAEEDSHDMPSESELPVDHERAQPLPEQTVATEETTVEAARGQDSPTEPAAETQPPVSSQTDVAAVDEQVATIAAEPHTQETALSVPDNGNIFNAAFTAADAPRAEVDEDALRGRERELWEYANRRNLSKREAGDRYERYLGYLYERAGWQVEYYGLTEGVANSNRGIDLICTKGGAIHFVQTKYWSDGVAAKTNINNVIDRIVKNMQNVVEKRRIQGNVQAVLAAKPKLSAEVEAYAAEQGVWLLDNLPVQPYPLVKCHTGKRGSKKYFLPFLQDKNPAKYEEIKQGAWEPYDLVEMNRANGDCYVHTIEEAEALGYKYSNRA